MNTFDYISIAAAITTSGVLFYMARRLVKETKLLNTNYYEINRDMKELRNKHLAGWSELTHPLESRIERLNNKLNKHIDEHEADDSARRKIERLRLAEEFAHALESGGAKHLKKVVEIEMAKEQSDYNERLGEFLRTLIELGEEDGGIRSVNQDGSPYEPEESK